MNPSVLIRADPVYSLHSVERRAWERTHAIHKERITKPRGDIGRSALPGRLPSLEKAIQNGKRFRRLEKEGCRHHTNELMLTRICEVAQKSARRQQHIHTHGSVENSISTKGSASARMYDKALKRENLLLAKRLTSVEPAVCVKKQFEDFKKHEAYRRLRLKYAHLKDQDLQAPVSRKPHSARLAGGNGPCGPVRPSHPISSELLAAAVPRPQAPDTTPEVTPETVPEAEPSLPSAATLEPAVEVSEEVLSPASDSSYSDGFEDDSPRQALAKSISIAGSISESEIEERTDLICSPSPLAETLPSEREPSPSPLAETLPSEKEPSTPARLELQTPKSRGSDQYSESFDHSEISL